MKLSDSSDTSLSLSRSPVFPSLCGLAIFPFVFLFSDYLCIWRACERSCDFDMWFINENETNLSLARFPSRSDECADLAT